MTKAHPVSLDFAEALDHKFHDPDYPYAQYIGSFAVLAGQKFDKIIIEQDNGTRSVHAFIERSTQRLIKAAGWQAPQKRADGTLAVRFDLSTPEGFMEALSAADANGGYLYAR